MLALRFFLGRNRKAQAINTIAATIIREIQM
jgi:hypothetical protein